MDEAKRANPAVFLGWSLITPFRIIVVGDIVLMLGAALLHRLQFEWGDPQAYAHSPVAMILCLGFISGGAILPLALIRWLVFTAQRRFVDAGCDLMLGLLTFCAWLIAFWIDFPLVYITSRPAVNSWAVVDNPVRRWNLGSFPFQAHAENGKLPDFPQS